MAKSKKPSKPGKPSKANKIKVSKTSKTNKTTRESVMREKFDRIARMINSSADEIETLAASVENAFLSAGKAQKRPNGRIVVFATKPIPVTFTNSKHVVKLRALVKDGIDCPIAKAAKDPDSCWLGAFSTSVHVGNVSITFWSELCPHITVRAMLPPVMRDAIRNWDEQVKRKAKNRRFNLPDGTYYFAPCPPSWVSRGPRGARGTRGKNTHQPTRRLTVRSDISLAIAATAARLTDSARKKKKS